MAAETDLRIVNTAVQSWWLAHAAFSRMRVLFVVVIVLSGAVTLSSMAMVEREVWKPSFGLLSSFIESLLLTPLLIAVHRFVLLGEDTQRYVVKPTDRRFMYFFGVAVVYKLLFFLADALIATTELGEVAEWGLTVVFLFAVAPLVMLFPAIAVDARGAQWRNAFADASGHWWRIFAILAVTIAPVLLLIAALIVVVGLWTGVGVWLLDSKVFGHAFMWLAVGFGSSVIDVISLTVLAAAASRLFAAYANRLNGPPAVSP